MIIQLAKRSPFHSLKNCQNKLINKHKNFTFKVGALVEIPLLFFKHLVNYNWYVFKKFKGLIFKHLARLKHFKGFKVVPGPRDGVRNRIADTRNQLTKTSILYLPPEPSH